MKSMTGYGFAELHSKKLRLVVELRSYNNRFLDIAIGLPQTLSPLEPRLREKLAARVSRGRVELTVRVSEYQENISILLDTKTAKAYAKNLRELAHAAGISANIQLIHLLLMEQILKTDGILRAERTTDVEEFWTLLEPEVGRALEDFEKTRVIEGGQTADDILSNLSVIESCVATVETFADELEENIKKNLKERFTELLGASYDETRVLAETAVLLVKSTVSEEMTRLKGHIAAFRLIANESGVVGKKLDFLCQELGREINTIGSKSTLLAVSQAVVEAKDALEKVREQLRNVE